MVHPNRTGDSTTEQSCLQLWDHESQTDFWAKKLTHLQLLTTEKALLKISFAGKGIESVPLSLCN